MFQSIIRWSCGRCAHSKAARSRHRDRRVAKAAPAGIGSANKQRQTAPIAPYAPAATPPKHAPYEQTAAAATNPFPKAAATDRILQTATTNPFPKAAATDRILQTATTNPFLKATATTNPFPITAAVVAARISRSAVTLACCATFISGCAGDTKGIPDETLGGLVYVESTDSPTIDVARAAKSPDELTRAATLPHTQISERLGPHRITETVTIEVRDDSGPAETFSSKSVLSVSAKGEFHSLVDNNRDYGRETIFANETLYVRPKYQKFAKRPLARFDEADQLRNELASEWNAHYELTAHAIAVSDDGTAKVSGRNGQKIGLTLKASPSKPKLPPQTQKSWRKSATVSSLTGNVVLDSETGTTLTATLNATLSFERDGKRYSMIFSVSRAIDQIGSVPNIVSPPIEESVDIPLRSKEVDERDLLLKGIAPAARKAKPPTSD